MNPSVFKYYNNTNEIEGIKDPFHEIIYIEDRNDLSWEKIHEIAPSFPKGWFELSKLSCEDRIEFTKEFWLNILPYRPHVNEFIEWFFSSLDDVGIFMTKDLKTSPYIVEMVYSIKNRNMFFRGQPPCDEEMIREIKKTFKNILPYDYLSFLHIHNGFCKNEDTGLIHAEMLRDVYNNFVNSIYHEGKIIYCKKRPVDPKTLIPFYQCFGRNAFQCFYIDWYPASEMGNVNYSGVDNTISNYHGVEGYTEHLSFSSFLDWLIFYLEEVKI